MTDTLTDTLADTSADTYTGVGLTSTLRYQCSVGFGNCFETDTLTDTLADTLTGTLTDTLTDVLGQGGTNLLWDKVQPSYLLGKNIGLPSGDERCSRQANVVRCKGGY